MLTFDAHVSRDQRTALLAILRRLRWYQPARWTSYAIGEDAAVEWTADADTAHATLGGGAIGEMRLRTLRDLGNQPVTITNLDYFGYPRNNGFVLMPSERLAYRGHGHAFEYAKTNGMITTVDINAGDFPA